MNVSTTCTLGVRAQNYKISMRYIHVIVITVRESTITIGDIVST